MNNRDMFGEICQAARAEGLAIVARMDSNRAGEEFYQVHPEWFCQDQNGEAIRAGGRYVACVNGPYYREWIPQILAEIVEREKPDGFGDNSWSGLARNKICFCDACRETFGGPLPQKQDWDDATYRRWITWNYARRVEIWEQNNALTREVGGEHCLWLGMVSADPHGASHTFRDMREIARRTPFLLLDAQFREDGGLFARNAENGDRWHELAGSDVPIAESMAQYQGVLPTFRRTAQSPPEARLWMESGIAGGLLPWWHHVGAKQNDRRQFQTPAQIFAWHADNEESLVGRKSLATVVVVWSQKNIDFHGRDLARERVMAPLCGACDALIRARIPYSLVHTDDLASQIARFSVVVLPEMAILSDAVCATLREFVAGGGGLVASGAVARRDETGDWRSACPLADVFGIETTDEKKGILSGADTGWDAAQRHSYLQVVQSTHPLFGGLEDTDLLPFGGVLNGARATSAQVLATYLPPFPIFPPETAWFEAPRNPFPALLASEFVSGRTVYFAADIERCFERDGLPDHARLLANAVRFVAKTPIPLEVSGADLLDCRLFRQENRLILHLVNQQNGAPAPLHELVAVGPFEIKVRRDLLPASALRARFLVGGTYGREFGLSTD